MFVIIMFINEDIYQFKGIETKSFEDLLKEIPNYNKILWSTDVDYVQNWEIWKLIKSTNEMEFEKDTPLNCLTYHKTEEESSWEENKSKYLIT